MADKLKRVKEYLYSVSSMDARIQSLERECRRLRSSQTFLHSPDLGTDKVAGGDGGGFTGLSERIADKEVEISRLRAERSRRDKKIRSQIGSIHGTYGDILSLRYLQHRPLMEIANQIGYSYYQTSRLHVVALEIFRARFFR